jgi:predicted outer membrane repeat protein
MSSSLACRVIKSKVGRLAVYPSRDSAIRSVYKRNCELPRNHLAASVILLLSSHTWAATITVNNSGGGTVAGACTLRDAIASVNSQTPAPGSNCAAGDGTNDTVVFGSAIVDVVFSVPTSGKSSALAASANLTIDGGALSANGMPRVTIERSIVSGVPNFRLIESNSNLSLKNLAMTGGSAVAGENGGGIEMTAASTLNISGSVISNNRSTGMIGGAIYGRTIDITSSTVRWCHLCDHCQYRLLRRKR